MSWRYLRRLCGFLALLTSMVAFGQEGRGGKKTILVTGFEPFGGDAVNNSWEVTRAFEADFESRNPDYDVVTCRLPVVFGRAADAAKQCVARLPSRPEMVLSLGESHCAIKLETVARNFSQTGSMPDNEGNFRDGGPILPEAPERLGFDFPVHRLFCSVDPRRRAQLDVSNSAGSFVCNEVAFRLAWEFRGTGMPFSFIHVPSNFCANADPAANASLLGTMIGAVARDLEQARAGERPDPRSGSVLQSAHCSPSPAMPVDANQIDALLGAAAAGQRDPGCEQDFFRRLKRRYP